jgi:hypothetical protein
VVSITVPAGSYLLGAKTSIYSSAGPTVQCRLAETGAANAFWDSGSETVSTNGYATFSMVTVATFTAPQEVHLSCISPDPASAFDARVSAIKTGSLHATLPLPHD